MTDLVIDEELGMKEWLKHVCTVRVRLRGRGHGRGFCSHDGRIISEIWTGVLNRKIGLRETSESEEERSSIHEKAPARANCLYAPRKCKRSTL